MDFVLYRGLPRLRLPGGRHRKWERKCSMKHGIIGSCLLSVVLVGAFAAAARADECDKQTYLTFSAPVSLPGVVLPAGTYLFSHLKCSSISNILRITSADGSHLYATLLVIPENRP